MQGFLHCVWSLRMHFELFLLKNGRNSVENYHIGIKFKLALQIILRSP